MPAPPATPGPGRDGQDGRGDRGGRAPGDRSPGRNGSPERSGPPGWNRSPGRNGSPGRYGSPTRNGSPGQYGEDAFEPDVPGESERIDYGALTYDPLTRARLLALGVAPGWRCLDAGAGTGTVSRWLAHDVGVAEVVAVDRDIRFLSDAADATLRPLSADVTNPSFDPGRFDLVHTRFLLMHLPGHEQVLSRLAGLVAPGGWLLVSDAVELTADASPDAPNSRASPDALDSPDSPYRAAMRAMWQALRETIGTDIGWVPGYPRRLRAAGLTDVGAEVYVPPLGPGRPITAFWLETWARLRGPMLGTGLVDARTLDAAEESLASGSCTGLSPGMISAWGRRP
ncbi:methyltransferase domain-containing protein [Streptomyces sp. NPDC002055]|uniref:class I SAM-dependent methyltransferase n=1 Tax=Streptomyces sp. NPDC002055 TaxID=3154534 RepID=UPI003318C88B